MARRPVQPRTGGPRRVIPGKSRSSHSPAQALRRRRPSLTLGLAGLCFVACDLLEGPARILRASSGAAYRAYHCWGVGERNKDAGPGLARLGLSLAQRKVSSKFTVSLGGRGGRAGHGTCSNGGCNSGFKIELYPIRNDAIMRDSMTRQDTFTC